MAFAELKARQSVMWGNGPYERITNTLRDIHALVIERADPKLGVDRDANRAKLALSWRKQIGAYRRRGLGEAIGIEQRCVKQVLQRANRRKRKGS